MSVDSSPIATKLPEWLEVILPEPKPTAEMIAKDNGTRFILVYEGEEQEFSNFEDAWRAVRHSKHDYRIDPSVYNAINSVSLFPGGDLNGIPREDGSLEVIMNSTDADRKQSLIDCYQDFLDAAARYRANPKDFVAAWEFIDRHPAFWTVPDAEKLPFSWLQSGHMSNITIWAYKDDDSGENRVRLETGAHVPTADEFTAPYIRHYGDWRLEVVGHTYEEGVVLLAERLNLTHDDEGNDRPDADEIFESLKPDWIIELEKRLED